MLSGDKIRILLNRFRERLWVKPTAIALLSVVASFASKLADGTGLARFVPDIALESIESLLSVMAASMLVIATFAVASMVSAYASASSVATPRSFALVISDDVSQNALSTFIGAFIFSIVSLTAVKNEYFGEAGLFCLFVLTLAVFAIVILTFLRWVDRVARLGRLGATIDKVEKAADGALRRRRIAPTLCARPQSGASASGRPVYSHTVGYVQHLDISRMQAWAEEEDAFVVVSALPGAFAAPGRALAYVSPGAGQESVEADTEPLVEAFQVGDERLFDDDPRFGLVVMAEIAGRALSPAVNDPGTAIDIIGTLVRLFVRWSKPVPSEETAAIRYDRVQVPEVAVADMFDDAFTAIARDGAGTVEVMVRLQKALQCLALAGDRPMRDAAMHHGRLAVARAAQALKLPDDLEVVRVAAKWAGSAPD